MLSLFCFQNVAWGTIYVANTAQGAGTGVDPADAYGMSFPNTAGNWGGGAGQIGPGVTVQFVGPITTALTMQGSGDYGNPIVFQFGTGSYMSSLAAGAMIIGTDKNYITIDGMGTNNGAIFCRSNGVNLPFTNVVSAIFVTRGIGWTVENLAVTNMFMMVSGLNNAGGGGTSVFFSQSCSSNIVTNCLFADNSTAVGFSYNGQCTNNLITGCVAYHHNWAYEAGDGGTGSILNGFTVSNCVAYDWTNWGYGGVPDIGNHHNGIFVFANSLAIATNIFLVNDLLGPKFGGGNQTAAIFVNGQVYNLNILNTVFNGQDGTAVGNGYITLGNLSFNSQYSTTLVANCSFVASGQTTASIQAAGNNANPTAKYPVYYFTNNIHQGTRFAVNLQYTDDAQSPHIKVGMDYSLLYGMSATPFAFNGSGYSVAAWQAASGGVWETNIQRGNPLLNATYTPQSGSFAISNGVNLTASFTYDFYGNTRPSTGPWNIGAVQGTATNPPSSAGLSLVGSVTGLTLKGGGNLILKGQ